MYQDTFELAAKNVALPARRGKTVLWALPDLAHLTHAWDALQNDDWISKVSPGFTSYWIYYRSGGRILLSVSSEETFQGIQSDLVFLPPDVNSFVLESATLAARGGTEFVSWGDV